MLQSSIQPWLGYAVRHIPDGPYNVYDFSRAGLASDNRWNVQGEPTLYLASEKDVALGEYARHFKVDRSETLARQVKRRKVYRFKVQLAHTLNLCDAQVWQALSLKNAPTCFLDKAVARATAQFIRRTTDVEAIFVPSVVFLDQIDKWVLVIFLEKLQCDPYQFLPAVMEDGFFEVAS